MPDGRQRVVRHGYGPERSIQTGIGALEVRRPKVRDRAGVLAERKIRFSSAILPRWARRSKSLDALLPVLYLRGVSTGDFQEALAAILGTDAPNLSPTVISRLTGEWQQDYDRWQRRDLSARRYVYIWADGVYLQARMEAQAECMLVILGTTPEGRKELVGFQVGVRESAQSWRELLVDIKKRGLPAEHCDHLRTGTPIESVFATVRHRTVRTKGALSQKTAKLMVFKLLQAAAKTWRRLKCAARLPQLIEGVTVTDGVAARHTGPPPPDQAVSPELRHGSCPTGGR